MSDRHRQPCELPAEAIDQLIQERRAAAADRNAVEERRREEGLARARAAALPAAQRLADHLDDLDLGVKTTADDLTTVRWDYAAGRPVVEIGCPLATISTGEGGRPRAWRVLAVSTHGEHRVRVETSGYGIATPWVHDVGPLARNTIARAVSDPRTVLDGAEHLNPDPPLAEPPTPAEHARRLLDELDADPTNRHGQRGIALAQAWATLAAATT
ncbi:hypothetical protein [Nocardiopsis baichengensis]|uniref:hypothetical protein n=1 Tax=Nocardiopsis baichengensis TaxID=280240 RepID=UPI00034B1046|nr:hypothetical protein [Nocardiopsis baichengensis]